MSPLLPRAPRALLRMDAIVVQRKSIAVDVEGNSSAGRTLIFTGRGTVTSGPSSEQILGGKRATRLDQILSLELGLDVQAGDFVTTGGVTYEVVQIDQRRLFQRAVMRVEV